MLYRWRDRPVPSGLPRVPLKAVAAAWPHPPSQQAARLAARRDCASNHFARYTAPDTSSSGMRRHLNAGVAARGAPPSRLRQPQAVATCKQNNGSWVLRRRHNAQIRQRSGAFIGRTVVQTRAPRPATAHRLPVSGGSRYAMGAPRPNSPAPSASSLTLQLASWQRTGPRQRVSALEESHRDLGH